MTDLTVVETLRGKIDGQEIRARAKIWREFLLARSIGTDGCNMRARPYPL